MVFEQKGSDGLRNRPLLAHADEIPRIKPVFIPPLGYLEEPHSGGIGLSATPAGKHFSFGHPALLLSQLHVGNFLSSRLVCPER